MAAAIGNPVQLPLIVRHLAYLRYTESLVPGGSSWPLTFKLVLDTGCANDDPAVVVDMYHNKWWTRKKLSDTKPLLSPTNIDACLAYHREKYKPRPISGPKLMKAAYTWSTLPRTVDPRDSHSDPPTSCERCTLYCGMGMAIHSQYQELHLATQAIQAGFGGKADAAHRRAAMFFKLQERASQTMTYEECRKRWVDPARPTEKRTDKPRGKAERFREHSEMERKRYENIPHLQWTVGESLSDEEVIRACKLQFPPGPSGHHSGYDLSLTWGDESYGTNSDAPRLESPGASDRYSLLGDNILSVPDLDTAHFPHHFTYPPLRTFWPDKPAGLAGPDNFPRTPAKLSFIIPPPPLQCQPVAKKVTFPPEVDIIYVADSDEDPAGIYSEGSE